MDQRWGALAPLTGVVFAILTVVALFIGGDRPDADAPAEEAVQFWVDNESANNVGGLLEALAAVALLFFAASLWRALRRGEGGGGLLPVAAVGGGIVAAAGLGVDAAIRVAAADVAADIDPVVTQTITAIWLNYGAPITLGIATLIFAASLSGLGNGAIPSSLAWIGIVISIAMFIAPIAFIASLAAFVWVVVVSAVLVGEQGGEAATRAA